MQCPFCYTNHTAVKDSRNIEKGKIVRRRRHCQECTGRFTTFERLETRQLSVIKRTGIKRPFEYSKILKSISIALRKRNFSNQTIEEFTDKIVVTLESSTANEIKSRSIGKLIMRELAKIDHVAYIRFASVYKDFSNVQDFAKFISKLS